jgi:predicted DNA-binding antitoxin AbrB/MazE fold protein
MNGLTGGPDMTTVKAIYENGVLRPAERLPFADGATVELTVSPAPAAAPPVDEQEVIRRMREAKSLRELFALYDSLPPPADGYDLCKALNENRKATGECLLYSELEEGGK